MHSNVGADDTILVTGGAGYIGSHACKYLKALGLCPIAYDDLSTGNEWAVRWGPLVVADISDIDTLQNTLDKHHITAVLHFAASAYVGESLVNPRKYFQNNTAKTITMLNALLDGGVRDIVFSSTCATYGNPRRLPIDEAHPQTPVNPYGESKLAIEKVLHWYGICYGLRWVSLRYFNVAGADLDGDIGEAHSDETHLVPLAINALFPEGELFRIFGSDYPTRDGTPVRDYIHVTDVARAHSLALEYLRSGGKSRPLNLGTGRGYSVLQVMRAIEEISGRHVRFIQCAPRPGDPSELVADPSAAVRELQWCPEYSDLKTIIRTAYSWATQRTRASNVAARSQAG